MTLFVPKTSRDLGTFWGQAPTVHWDSRTLEKISISVESKRFLTEIGLPQLSDCTLRFETSPSWVTSGLLLIGFDGPNPVCLARGDRVDSVILQELGQVTTRFVNRTVAEFGCFLALYQQYRLQAREVDETTDGSRIDELINDVERTMRNADESALNSAENYWPLILEQVRAGLL